MQAASNIDDWLSWLTRVRFLLITLLLAVVVVLQQYTDLVVPVRYFVPLVVLWYTLAIFYVILLRWVPQARWHAALEIVCDVILVTGLVYVTGGNESYFISLYLLAIIVASILFSRRATFLVAGLSFVLLGGLVELVYYEVLPRTAVSMPHAKALQTWILSNLLAFVAVAYLSSLLDAEPSPADRRARSEARRAAGLAGLQRRHHSLDARGIDHHRSRRAHHAGQPHSTGDHRAAI